MKNILLTILFSCIATVAFPSSECIQIHKNNNIIQTGPLTFRDLQKLNDLHFDKKPENQQSEEQQIDFQNDDNDAELDPQTQRMLGKYIERRRQPDYVRPQKIFDNQGIGTYYIPEADELFRGNRVFNANELQQLREIRAEEQKALLKKTIGIALGALAILFVTIAIVRRKK